MRKFKNAFIGYLSSFYICTFLSAMSLFAWDICAADSHCFYENETAILPLLVEAIKAGGWSCSDRALTQFRVSKETGERLIDYRNHGIVVLKLIAKRNGNVKNKVTETKHDAHEGNGICIVGLRVKVGPPHAIKLLAVFDQTDEVQFKKYNELIKKLTGDSEEPRASGYFTGRPCNPARDTNKAPYNFTVATPEDISSLNFPIPGEDNR
jgi:hypothetical protein